MTAARCSRRVDAPAQLQGFVRNTNQLFATTASRDAALAATIRAFPAFLAQTRVTTDTVGRFAANTKPLIDELHPAATQLNPALQSVDQLTPTLQTLMDNIPPLTGAGRTGLPALGSFLTEGVPFLTALKPFLGQLDPVINYIDTYRRELAGVLRQRDGSEPGPELGSHRRPNGPLSAGLQPDRSGVGRHLSADAVLEPIEPVSRPRRLRRTAQRSAGVRQLPLHRQSAADGQSGADHRNYVGGQCVNAPTSCATVLLHR